mmetsp:Transcript_10615/g.31030  ORF Transcript_10615/g.31030 Transcript_10615/m.31030 type:complete len:183 (-) Transcript_10615:280-828(-)|eukprot:CAMPEP_0172366408 /NCGR_PEP_ID=MMETSP1060-20121228/14916_1 /TAXON_ID=37318 /ORGANISM="Pseudo-nitzschia pungens, Strain cf. cingulata" /LENGTH=182 /DNA_ID=CAMNT_0013090243 /DNA_START=98 /DNA_END=646 /DNA_ORIENTATION=-
MKSLSSILLSLCLLLAVGLFPNGSWALTGAGTGAEKETTEEEALKLMGDAQKLKDILPEMSTDDALTIAQLLEDIRNDPDSQQLIEDLKSSKVAQEPQMQQMLEGMSKKEVVVTLNQVLDELRAVEVLFQDPAKAVDELHKEGLIQAAHLSEYQENPELLERDIRNGLHFSFVTFSMAAELL